MSGYNLGSITVSKENVTQSKVLEMCDKYGICVIDSFLDDELLEAVRAEFHELYNVDEHSGVNSNSNTDYTHALNINWGSMNKQDFPAISDLVSTPLFESVTREYFTEEDVQYPANLWAAKSKGVPNGPTGDPSDGAPYAYHFDRTNKFKFFFYLTDVGVENGATRFIPEYHKRYKKNRLKWSEEHDPRELSNVIWHYHISDDAKEKEVPIVGDAGTLIIFDTDVPHRAGELETGCEREIMRIDTLSPTHSALDKSYNSLNYYLKEGLKNPTKAARTLFDKATQ